MNIRSTSTKLMLSFCLVFIAFTLFNFYFIHIPLQRKNIVTNLSDKAAAIFSSSQISILNALKNNDDVTLFSSVENIAKINDVLSAYVVDGKGKVITHNNIEELGKVYDSSLSKKAPATQRSFTYESSVNSFLFSFPLTNSYTLFINLSQEQYLKNAKADNNKYLLLTLIFFLLSLFVLFLIIHFTIIARFSLLSKYIRSASSMEHCMPKMHNDEFGLLYSRINELIERNRSFSQQPNNAENNVLINKICEFVQFPLLIIDPDNMIIACNNNSKFDIGRQMNPNSNAHIIENIGNIKVFELVKQSRGKPNTVIESEGIKALSVLDSNFKNIGTLVFQGKTT